MLPPGVLSITQKVIRRSEAVKVFNNAHVKTETEEVTLLRTTDAELDSLPTEQGSPPCLASAACCVHVVRPSWATLLANLLASKYQKNRAGREHPTPHAVPKVFECRSRSLRSLATHCGWRHISGIQG